MGKRWLVATALGALLVALATGCGSSKKSSASPPAAPTTTAAATTTEATTTDTTSTTTSSSSGAKPSFASTKNCAQLASLASQIAKSATPNANGTVDLSREVDAMKALAAAAPSEIKGDFQTFADAFANFAKVYGSNGFKPGTAPTAAQIAKLTAAAKSLSTPKLQAAEQHLSAWASTNCGLSKTSP